MKKVIAAIGLLAIGAVGWSMYGGRVTDKAANMQAEVYGQAQDIADAIKPEQ